VSKREKTALAIKETVSVAARQLAALNQNASRVLASEDDRRRLRLLCSPSGAQGVVDAGPFIFEFQGDTFAVTSRD
jgi:hypothetical protein